MTKALITKQNKKKTRRNVDTDTQTDCVSNMKAQIHMCLKPPETRRLAQTLPHGGQKDSSLPKLDLGLLASTTIRQ